MKNNDSIFFIDRYIHKLILKKEEATGGASVQSLAWINGFGSLGFDVYLAKFVNSELDVKENYRWIKQAYLYNPTKLKKRLVWFTYRFPRTYQAIKKSKCQFVYTSMPNWTSFFHGIICKLLGIKHIIRTANDKNIDFTLDKTIKWKDRVFINLAYLTSDLILAQNNFQYSELKRKFPKKRIEKIGNPIVLKNSFLTPRIKMEGYIAWVGNFRYQKNFKLLFEIAKSNPQEQFKIAGKSLLNLDSETSYYHEQLKQLSNVEFVGTIPQENILHFFKDAKFLLNTSRFEGFSNTFLEAMMTGLPIISPIHINPDKIITEFDLGFVFNDASELKKILSDVTFDKYIGISENCINYLKEYHDHIKLIYTLKRFLESN
ncbi:MAG: glycosyltransferase [Mongoliitalea sp.]